MVEHHRLSPYSACFEPDRMPNYGFVSKIGLERLLAEAPEIAQEFGIEAPPVDTAQVVNSRTSPA